MSIFLKLNSVSQIFYSPQRQLRVSTRNYDGKPVHFRTFCNSMLVLACLLWIGVGSIKAQETENEDAFFVKSIYDAAFTEGQAYDWLRVLTKDIGGRLAGSPGAAAAVEFTRQMLDTMGLDRVYLQPCRVPHWVRGEPEVVRIVSSRKLGSVDLRALALGNSVGTGPGGLTAEVIEVQGLDKLEELGEAQLRGKIVFFNRPMDPTQVNTFAAYGGAVDQRGLGATRAARYGAVGAVVRSMTNQLDDEPHTGAMRYEEGVPKIPAVAISTNDAELLSDLLDVEPVRLHVRTTCEMRSDQLSYNVIGEITGSTHSDEIILVGGHLDSWDVGEGAHDDGAGCVQSMDVLHLLRTVGYRPKRTLRCVLFMNEENGLGGGRAYADSSNVRNEYHLAAIESDAGGFTPRGFAAEAEPDVFPGKMQQVKDWLPLLEPYGLTFFPGGSGADIRPLRLQNGLLLGLRPDSQRYFDYHHTAADTLETVSNRELALGSAAMTALVYLLDKYGLE